MADKSKLILTQINAVVKTSHSIEKEVTVLGREEVDINLSDNSVSRRHAKITRQNGFFYVEDLGSHNGTFLDGNPITARTHLLSGARLQIGRIMFSVAIEGGAASPSPLSEDSHSSTISLKLDAPMRDILTTPDAVDLKTLKRAKDDLATLYRVGQSISTILDLDELYTKILEILMGELKTVDYASLHILDEQSGTLSCVASHHREGHPSSKDFVFSQSIVDCVLRERKAVLVKDAQDAGRFNPSVSISGLNIHSAMCVPLQSRERIFGVIQASALKSVTFTKDDLTLLAAIGMQDGAAIENAMLYDKLAVEKTALKETNEELQIAQQNLVQSETLYDLVLKATNDIIYDRNFSDDVLWWNENIQLIFGYDQKDIPCTFEKWTSMIHPDDAARVFASVETTLRNKKDSWQEEYRMRKKDGSYLHVLDRSFVLYAPDGTPLRWVGSLLDLSKKKEIEERLLEARDKALELSSAKSAFLATMSHEIRTPMNGIIGLTELLFHTSLTELQHRYLSGVRSSASSLLAIINDILDLSKIEAGKLVLESTPFSLDRHLVSLLRGLAVHAYEKRVELLLFITPCVPDGLMGDPDRFAQIINNLVGNAIKFTERGEITIKVETAERVGDEVDLHFSVKDSGIGIPAENQHLLFQEFSQTDSSITRKFGGTGLGLTITKRLVGMMGGRIWFESEPGKGSVFHFTVRFPVCSPPASEQSQSTNLDGIHVLVADDNEYSRELFRAVLEKWRTVPTTVGDGFEALTELRRAAAAGSAYPILLLDLLMPGMNGMAVIEQIRKEPVLSPTKILVISQSQEPAVIEKLKNLGVDAFAKPFSQSELLNALQNLLHKKPISSGFRFGRGGKPDRVEPITDAKWGGKPLRILLAEDNPINQMVVTGMLTPNHHVTVVDSGRKAIEAFKDGAFDVILMDVSMPEVDGYVATRAIREFELASGTPSHIAIIATTANAMSEDCDRCLKAGMDAYLPKPIRRNELFAALERISAKGEPPATISTTPPLFNPEKLMAEIGNDKQRILKIISTSIEHLPLMLEEVRADIRADDPDRVLLSTHKLKGSLAVFNHEIAEKARQIETTIKTHTANDIDASFDELSEMMGRLVAEMKDYMECGAHNDDSDKRSKLLEAVSS